MKSTRFKVAEHIFDVSSAQTDIVKILPNLEPFVSSCDGEPLYTINIDNSINPSWRGSRIGYFPCPSASFEVYRMDNGAYQVTVNTSSFQSPHAVRNQASLLGSIMH